MNSDIRIVGRGEDVNVEQAKSSILSDIGAGLVLLVLFAVIVLGAIAFA